MSDSIILKIFLGKLPETMDLAQKLIKTKELMKVMAHVLSDDPAFDQARELLKSGDQRILFNRHDIHGLTIGVSPDIDILIDEFETYWSYFDQAMTIVMNIPDPDDTQYKISNPLTK